MQQPREGAIVVGLDIGTTKICAVVGEVIGKDINIIGIGTHPSIGLRKGVVVNIESTVESIKKAVEEAELMAGCEISSFMPESPVATSPFQQPGHRGHQGIGNHGTGCGTGYRCGQGRGHSHGQEVIHVLPQEYIVDDQTGIQNPVGMAGVRLEAKIHIVTGAVTSAHNIVKCANRAGLDVCDIVLESLASGEAVLADEEKQLGTGLIDLGGGTSDLAIFSGKNIKHTFVLALGGDNLTNDIAIGVRAPLNEAERIKRKYGTCLGGEISPEETIEVPGMGGRSPRKMPRQILGEILEPRMEEIFTLLQREIFRAGMENMIASGMVLTRRNFPSGRCRRDRRVDFRGSHPAGASPGHQRPYRRGKQSHVRHGRRAGDIWGKKGTGAKVSHPGQKHLQQHYRKDEEMVQGRSLIQR